MWFMEIYDTVQQVCWMYTLNIIFYLWRLNKNLSFVQKLYKINVFMYVAKLERSAKSRILINHNVLLQRFLAFCNTFVLQLTGELNMSPSAGI